MSDMISDIIEFITLFLFLWIPCMIGARVMSWATRLDAIDREKTTWNVWVAGRQTRGMLMNWWKRFWARPPKCTTCGKTLCWITLQGFARDESFKLDGGNLFYCEEDELVLRAKWIRDKGWSGLDRFYISPAK